MPRKLTQEQFITKAIAIHGDKYDYSKVVYVNNYTKVIIICPIHGEFLQQPSVHLNGNGCHKCSCDKIKKILSFTKEKFIEKSIIKHGNTYGYDLVNYINSWTKVELICYIHGSFHQTPDSHMSGNGCPKCKYDNLSKKFVSNTQEFVVKARAIHGDRYGYGKVKYINVKTYVILECYIHGDFYQKPNGHLNGQGCPMCKSSKGELLLYNVFIKNKIKVEKEYKIPNNNFRYDFYLPEYNLLIEFHGKQHYKAIDYFGGEQGLKLIKERDRYKIFLAKFNNIPIMFFNYKHLKMNKNKFETMILETLQKIKKRRIIRWFCYEY